MQNTKTYETSPYTRFTRAIKTEATRKVYDNSLMLYIKYCQFTKHDQLLEGSNEAIEDRIMDFVSAQVEDGLSSAIIATRLAAIKLFYDMNRRMLAWKLIRKNLKSTPKKHHDTVMTTAGISLLYVDMLEGHDVKLKGNYFKPTDEELLEGNDKMRGYVAAIDPLTINEENRLRKYVVKLKEELSSSAPRDMVYDLAKENKDLKEQMKAMHEAQEEIRDLLKDPIKLLAILKEK